MSDPSAKEAPEAFKDTLNLPKTDFPMKGNLTQLEPKLLGFWEEKRVYPRVLERNAKAQPFVLVDGPPYANGHLHAGHALNKILKDIVVKYQNQSGRRCDYIPGFDTHGLPIEQAVEKRLKEKKIDRRSLPRDEFLAQCKAYALEFIDIQTQEFQRLGVLGRWSEPYRTMDAPFEAQQIRALAAFARRGQLYRQKKPVYFCVNDQTALAEAEVEYEDKTSPSVYVAMRARSEDTAWPAPVPKSSQTKSIHSSFPFLAGKQVFFVVWTTTSWTLVANEAIAVHPKAEYVFYAVGERVLVVAKDLLPAVLKAIAPDQTLNPQRILGHVSGAELEGFAYEHPFRADKPRPVILGEHVTLDAGTGLVHTAPGHGHEDYVAGRAYGLPVYNPVGADGKYDDTVPEALRGQHVFKVAPLVAEMLANAGALLNAKTDTVRHSYPHCWRCRQPIIHAATYQWFIPMDFAATSGGKTFRAQVLDEVERVHWIPGWGKSRIRGMLENRPDWCISRQRTWGVPIPIVYCAKPSCDEALIEPSLAAQVMENLASRAETEGSGAWYREAPETFLPKGTACPRCKGTAFRRETDILDVWFDSACAFADVLERRLKTFPADLYLEGSDQHRGWFHSSMLVGVGARGQTPYKTCLTHGFVVDGEGRKMSKSVGNVVAPEKVIAQYGAEVLRLWVASSDYRDDVRLSDQILKGLAEGYRKIRNTLRYALSNLYDFDPAIDSVPRARLLPLDRWALARHTQLVEKVRRAYDSYEFHLVYHAVIEFCGVDLSAVYFDILKDRLYTAKAKGIARRSAQTVLEIIARDLIRLLAPITSFTSEEAWGFLPKRVGDAESVFLSDLPKSEPLAREDEALLDTYTQLFAVRKAAQEVLEVARREKKIGASLEAKLRISASGKTRALLDAHAAELPGLFIVSQVELVDGAELAVQVLPAEGAKCPRCWTYSTAVAPGRPVCEKCVSALA
ncbi:MAG: isoleucine--tRNA ligase [Myxococcaceae bacterium]